MSLLEIILILLGLAVIIISTRMIDQAGTAGKDMMVKLKPEEALNGEDLKRFKEEVREELTGLKEEIVVRTDDELSVISNEKIMAVGEYSDQILEKIKHNHEEVVFLYHMLSEKEKELKTTVTALEASRKKLQEVQTVKAEEKEQPPKKVTGIQQLQGQRQRVAESPIPKEKAPEPKAIPEVDQGTNNNAQILALYSNGKSVVEISRLLGLGQGEVKLVIDLFKGRK